MILIYNVCRRGFQNNSADDKKTTFVVIGAFRINASRVKSGNFGHRVNSEIHLQTVEIQIRRLLMSRLIRIFTVCFLYLFFIPIIKIRNKQGCCPNFTDVRSYPTLPLVLIENKLSSKVMSGKFGHQVNSDTHLQTV